MITISEVSTQDDFHNLKNEWNDLLSRSESNNIFLTWEWLYYWWEFFGYDKKLKILLVKDGIELIGIAPFFIFKSGIRNTHQIKFLGSTHVGSDYLDFILKKGSEDKILLAIFDYLNSNESKWQTINLTNLSAKSKSIGLIQNFSKDKFYHVRKKHNICPYIPLPDSYELFLESLSSNMRYNIGRKRRRFENSFKGDFIVINEKSELKKLIEELFRLNFNRARIKNIDSPFYSKQFSQFHSKLIKSISDKGWVKLCFLKVENKLIACLYIFQYGRKYYFYQSGFDLKWEKISPGFLLFSYCIENAILEGMNEFDFLQGEEKYKFSWAKNIRTNLHINIYRKNLKNKARYLGEKFKMISKSKIKKSLNKLNLTIQPRIDTNRHE